jgi:hypothetical protein
MNTGTKSRKASKDYTGHKFHHLTLLEYSHSGGAVYGAMWSALCDCGTEKIVALKNLTSGRVKTCGKCEWHRQLVSQPRSTTPRSSAREQKLFQSYLKRAMGHKQKWALTMREFLGIIEKRCALCGSGPTNKRRGSKIPHSYLGRIEIEVGYTVENSYPICRPCDKLVSERNLEQFLDHVHRITQHLQETSTLEG